MPFFWRFGIGRCSFAHLDMVYQMRMSATMAAMRMHGMRSDMSSMQYRSVARRTYATGMTDTTGTMYVNIHGGVD